MTKISGIKGINISKSSVLKDGSKKSSTNDSFRDTANGTTRDNSKNNNQSALDAAMIKMLLGQTELMAKKAASIEEQMKIAAQKEEDRQKREAEYWKKKEEYEEQKKERKFDEAYNKVDNGVVNSILSGILGPGAVMLGKGLNAAGIPLEKWGKKGLRLGGKLINKGLDATLGRWTRKYDEESENALSVNRKEEAAKPINNLNTTVSEGFKSVLAAMKGKGGEGKGEEDEESWLSKLLKGLLPLLAGHLLDYKPLKDFGWKRLIRRFSKPLDWLAKKLGQAGSWIFKRLKGPLQKLGSKLWNTIKGPLQKVGSKIWNAIKTPFKKIGSKVWSVLKGPLQKAGSSIKGAFAKLSSKIMNNSFVRSLKKFGSSLWNKTKSVANKVITPLKKIGSKAISKIADSALGRGLKKLATKSAGKIAAKGGLKSLLKKIPIVSTLAGTVFAVQRALKGDWTGAGLEMASGLVANVPLVGTGASLALDGINLYRDIKRDIDAESQPQNTTSSEGTYETEEPSYNNLQLQQEQSDKQNEIVNLLRQIEWNLKPEVQQSLDQKYLDTAQRMFEQPPTAPNYDFGINGGMMNHMSNPLGLQSN